MKNREELLEKYFQGKLTKDENVIFENLLNTDVYFKQAFTFEKDLKDAVKTNDDENFRDFITDVENKVRSKDKRKSYTKWMAVAGILLLLGIGYLLRFDTTNNNETLFADYFEPYRNIIYPVQRNEQSQDDKAFPFEVYEYGNYKKAAVLFSEMYAKNKESYNLFYQANALLKTGNAKEALPLLLKHRKTKDKLSEKNTWYLALTYLKLDNKENAKKALQDVIDQNSYKVKEAKQLLKALE